MTLSKIKGFKHYLYNSATSRVHREAHVRENRSGKAIRYNEIILKPQNAGLTLGYKMARDPSAKHEFISLSEIQTLTA